MFPLSSAAMAKHSLHILDLARRGAEHRYAELRAEIAQLVKHFPDVARTGGAPAARGRKAVKAASNESPGKSGGRKRRGMSAAARKAVSERMKAYWAKRRAGKKKR
jgi:hypothetical protein